MPYLIAILITGLLFFGFLAVTVYETHRGIRLFGASRAELDRRVERMSFLLEHVDWGAFTAHLTRTSLETIMHDVAHGTLMLVRSAERGLTRMVRALRMRQEGLATPVRRDAPRLAGAVTHVRRTLYRSRKPQVDMVRKVEVQEERAAEEGGEGEVSPG